MSRSDDLAVDYLETLHRHRALVAQAWHQGRIQAGAEPATDRGIAELRRHRTFVPLDQDGFRLSASLSRHLDEVLQKERLFAAIGSDVADLVARLDPLVDEVSRAHLDGRTEDLDAYADAFHEAVFDLSDQVSNALDTLRVLADTRFANVRTLAEKQRQNTWYIGRAERLGEALKALQHDRWPERLEAAPGCTSLSGVFRDQIWQRLARWRESLLDITEILKQFLYRLREIEPAGRRLRAFDLFLRRNQGYAVPEVADLPDLPAFAIKAAPIRLLAHPDLSWSTGTEALIKIAESLPARPTPAVAKRPPRIGTLSPDQGADGALSLVPHLWQRALQRLLVAIPADGVRLSALDWKRAQPDFADLPDVIWLHCVLYEAGLARRRVAHLHFERQEAPLTHRLSGNIVVHDVLICLRSAAADAPAPPPPS